ncbi:MAG: Ryanodine receptor Ryr [Ruminococcus sp.]|nr:Ryanodine receptor Ryr [Ruminococcus sp.]
MKTYTPEPIDTSDVVLSEELEAAAELLARNTHEVWSAGRIAQGWTYGKRRDDEKKTTPCLIPYDELPDEEKEYDIATSMETVKVLLKLGYRIEKAE